MGQLPYFQQMGRGLYIKAELWVRSLWQSGVDFWNRHILGKVTSEIDKRQAIVKKEIGSQAQQVGQNVWQQIKDYFLGLIGQKQAAAK
jgi:hypothetical protein